MQLTIYYDGQYWVGVVEQVEGGRMKAARHVFGAEPRDHEVLFFVNQLLPKMVATLTESVEVPVKRSDPVSVKRLLKQAAMDTQKRGASTYAYDATRLQYEQNKKLRKVVSREEKEALREKKREIARQKAKAKHRGR